MSDSLQKGSVPPGAEPEPEPNAHQPGRVTCLTSHNGKPLSKSYEISTAGPVSLATYPKETWFAVKQHTLSGVRHLHALLLRMESFPTMCIIRGEPVPGTNLSKWQRKIKVENGGVFADVPRAWALLDCDNIPAPASFNVLDDPAEAASALLDNLAAQVPEL